MQIKIQKKLKYRAILICISVGSGLMDNCK